MRQSQYRNQASNYKVEQGKRKKRRCYGIILLMSGLLFTGAVACEKLSAFGSVQDDAGMEQSWNDVESGYAVTGINLERLYSHYAVLMVPDSGEILAERNADEKIYPASMTKIMTAILAIENCDDLNEIVTLPEGIFQALYNEGASMAGFVSGEEATLQDLLYGVLLPSGAECCVTFADRIAGSEVQFAELMNEKAEELGMDGTHFCNSTGLHEPEHYSTVKDIGILLKYALQNQVFREAFCSSRYSMQPTECHPDGFTFYSTLFSNMESVDVIGGTILGGKTGYTEESGLCLASLASVNGREYILVTAKADGTHETEPFHILDAVDVYSQIGENSIGVQGGWKIGGNE